MGLEDILASRCIAIPNVAPVSGQNPIDAPEN
jgi:hypothetical protein